MANVYEKTRKLPVGDQESMLSLVRLTDIACCQLAVIMHLKSYAAARDTLDIKKATKLLYNLKFQKLQTTRTVLNLRLRSRIKDKASKNETYSHVES